MADRVLTIEVRPDYFEMAAPVEIAECDSHSRTFRRNDIGGNERKDYPREVYVMLGGTANAAIFVFP